jgi:hypothetical protein
MSAFDRIKGIDFKIGQIRQVVKAYTKSLNLINKKLALAIDMSVRNSIES